MDKHWVVSALAHGATNNALLHTPLHTFGHYTSGKKIRVRGQKLRAREVLLNIVRFLSLAYGSFSILTSSEWEGLFLHGLTNGLGCHSFGFYQFDM